MLGTIWNTVFYQPILNVLLLLYWLFGGNLGWGIIFLTIVLKLLLYPMTKKQLESSEKLKLIQPQLEKIKKKYSRNPKKVQEEQLKLYKKVGYNPMGCFFSILIPLPAMIAIYQVIRLFSADVISSESVYEFVANIMNINGDLVVNTNFLFWDLSKSYTPLAKEYGYFTLWLIPYLALALFTGLSQYVSVKVSTPKSEPKPKKSKKKKDDEPDPAEMMTEMSKSMAITFPLMTAFLALSMPTALSLYWCVQSWVTVGLRYAYNKFKAKKLSEQN